jgi:F-type H+-transporting ATPase subunit b
MILFILLVIAYGLLVRRPLDRILNERRARTSGAMEQAKGAMAAAEAETGAYEEKLRKAKTELFEARELRLKQWAAERETALEQVRKIAQERVSSARQGIEQSIWDAKSQIEDTSAELSSRVLAAVMPASAKPAEVAQ